MAPRPKVHAWTLDPGAINVDDSQNRHVNKGTPEIIQTQGRALDSFSKSFIIYGLLILCYTKHIWMPNL